MQCLLEHGVEFSVSYGLNEVSAHEQLISVFNYTIKLQ